MKLLNNGVIESVDGAYSILGAGFDVDDLVDVPDGGSGPAVAAGLNHLLVATFGEWEPLEVTVILLPHPSPLHAPSWSSVLEATFVNQQSGPFLVADTEFAPNEPAIGVAIGPGKFGVRIATRSIEMVQGFYERGLWTKGEAEPMESHLIEVWPV